MRALVAVEQLRRAVPGGVGRYASGLLDALAAEGLGPDGSVDLLASRPPRRPDPLAAFGFAVHASPLPGPLLTRAWDHGRLGAPAGFDVVHSVSLAFPPPGRAALVVAVHDLAWQALPATTTRRGRRWHEAALTRALRRADALVVPSEPVAEALAAAGSRVATTVVAHGADHLPPPDHAGAEALLARLGVAGPYLLSVGTLEPRKNLDRLVAAYGAARRSLPEPWPLVVVGPPGWGDGWPRGAPTVGVVPAGPVDDAVLAALYQGARVFAYVPLLEGYGLPAVEAMGFGTPVVAATSVPSVTGAGSQGAAYLVDPMSTEAIAEGLVAVAADGGRRDALCEAGPALAGALEDLARVGPSPPRAVAVIRVSDPVSVSLDVTAVPAAPAGAGRYTLELAAALSRRPDVDLLLVARRADAARWRGLEVPSTGDPLRVLAVAPRARPLRLAWEQARLPRLLGREGPAVHHGPHYTMPERARLPVVVTVHDCTFFDHPEWHERSKAVLFRRAIAVAARRAAVVVCVSRTTADRLEEVCPPAGPVVVAPHGVDHRRFAPEEPSAGADRAALAGLGLDPGRPYVLFLGTVEPRKDVATLVRAFARLAPAHPDLHLVVAGRPGWGTGEVDRAVEVAGLGDRLVRTGWVDEAAVPALLRRAAAVAYPSLEEGYGLPALEALACGAPLVTTSGTAMAELAGGAALLVGPGDEARLAEALDAVLEDAGGTELAARRRRGLEVAAARTWEASASLHLDAYRLALR